MERRIHIFGASGSGTTTLGERLAERMGSLHLDADDFFWEQTELAFQNKRPVQDRLRLIDEAIGGDESWVLSGSLCSWGDSLIDRFTDVVFLWVPWEIRERRLREREALRFGAEALEPGGEMHRNHVEFLEWAGRYDSAGFEQRSLRTHEQWFGALPDRIRVLRIEERFTIDELVKCVVDELGL